MIDYHEDNKWTVYVHIVPKEISGNLNDKYYVGITSTGVAKRWKNGIGYKGQVFYRAVLKYGWNNIQHEIIAEHLTKDEACDFEKTLIKSLKSNDNIYGYNMDTGGNLGKELSMESRLKLSNSQPKFFGKENNNHIPVICLNDLTVFESIADANAWLGFKRNNSNISNVLNGTNDSKTIGKHPITGERCVWAYYDNNKDYKSISPPAKNNVNAKCVICCETQEVFKSATSAARYFNINRLFIGECCRGLREKCKNGYCYKFYTDYLKENNLTDEEARKSLFFIE